MHDHEIAPRALGGRFLVPLFVVLAVGLFVVLLLASDHEVIGNSDGATVVLEGQSMAQGNLLLHHWALSLDSFWSIDALLYCIAVGLFGVKAALLNAVPAAIAALVIVVAILLVGPARRRSFAVGSLVVVALLAFPAPAFAYFFLQGPLHVATLLWCLIAFFGISRGRLDWGVGLAAVFLALGLLGDFQTLALGVAPAVLSGLIAIARRRDWRAGLPGLVAATAGVVLALLARLVCDASGTFNLVRANPVAHRAQVAINFRHLPRYFAALLGVGNIPIGTSAPAGAVALQCVRAIGLVALLATLLWATVALFVGMWRGRRRDAADPTAPQRWRLDDLLLLGFFADLCTFLVLSSTGNADYVRYLTAGVVFGAILCARLVGQWSEQWRGRAMARASAVGGGVVVAISAVGFGIGLTHLGPPAPARQLGDFLLRHDLRVGIGDYWSASLVTVDSDDTVVVRPVQAPRGVVSAFGRQDSSSWFETTRFQFLVYDLHRPWRGVDLASATASFGVPAHQYGVGTYRILVWPKAITVPLGGGPR